MAGRWRAWRCASTPRARSPRRGPDCCLGYTDAALTAAAFDDEGWYRTGDVGVLDSDGYLTITDRVSDIIIRGGENISAQEIEELLLHLDAVAEVAVVAAPDERLGEHAAAVVRTLPGASVDARGRAAPTSRRPGWPSRSGPSPCSRWRTFPARRRARSRSSSSASSFGTAHWKRRSSIVRVTL